MSCQWNPAGRWPAVEWPGSKPARWQTGLAAEERGGAHRKASLCRRGSTIGKRLRQARVGVTGGVRAVREDELGGAVLGVGSRRSKDGWSGLSAVSRIGRRGTAVVERRSRRGRQQGGRERSQHRCGAQGSDGEFRGGPGMAFHNGSMMMAWRHSGGNGGGGKRAAHCHTLVLRRWNRSLYTCAQDVQITRIVTIWWTDTISR
jgi:hypothetical protein